MGRILYVENEKEDIQRLAQQMADCLCLPFQETENAEDFLGRCSVDTVHDYEMACMKVKHEIYELYILDYMLDMYENAYDLLHVIRHENPRAEIWILSHISHMNESYVKSRGANRFFSKQKLAEMCEEILIHLRPKVQDEESKKVIGEEKGGKAYIDTGVVLYIKKKNNYWEICLFGTEGKASYRRILPRYSMKQWLETCLSPREKSKMMKVQRDCIINIEMIENIQFEEKGCYVTLRQKKETIYVSRRQTKELCRRLFLNRGQFSTYEKDPDT